MTNKAFNYNLDFSRINFRDHPELYRVGVGEQGVLLVQPYKSELLPLWRFRTEKIALKSAREIYGQFEKYISENDFIGADMARKYLQMGFTRARRYANHRSGRKYSKNERSPTKKYPYSSGSRFKNNAKLTQEADALTNEKARAAAIFKGYWIKAKNNFIYLLMKDLFNTAIVHQKRFS